MSQRNSGYARKDNELYETPEWVTMALLPHLPEDMDTVWEPAAGSGKIVRALRKAGLYVISSDATAGEDFMQMTDLPVGLGGIITNPPYQIATEFITKAIDDMRAVDGFVGMLLRTDFDHAKTRQSLFANHPAFSKKVVLTKRIKWFADSVGQPSFNHAWFVWDWRHRGPPILAYGP